MFSNNQSVIFNKTTFCIVDGMNKVLDLLETPVPVKGRFGMLSRKKEKKKKALKLGEKKEKKRRH